MPLYVSARRNGRALKLAPRTHRGAVTRSTYMRAGQADVVCMGEALFDMLADQKGKSKAEVTSWTGYPGGAPCNVACGLGLLKIPVAFFSCLGKDERGDELMSLIESRGVDTHAVCRIDAPTRDVYVVRTIDGERTFDSFGHDTSTYCDCFLPSAGVPRDAIAGAEFLVTGTLGLAYSETAAAMREAVTVAKASGTKVLVDLNWRPVFWPAPDRARDVILPFVRDADIVKITDDEAEWAFGIPADKALAEPSEVLKLLPSAAGVLVTAGGGGSSFCFRRADGSEHSGIVPVYQVDVQDTTGAGDAFTCGFLAYLLAEKRSEPIAELLQSTADWREAVEFGSACGALTTLEGGAIAAQPTLEQVERLVASRHQEE